MAVHMILCFSLGVVDRRGPDKHMIHSTHVMAAIGKLAFECLKHIMFAQWPKSQDLVIFMPMTDRQTGRLHMLWGKIVLIAGEYFSSLFGVSYYS